MRLWLPRAIRTPLRDQRGGVHLLLPLYKLVIEGGKYGPETSADFHPDAHPETNTVDGEVSYVSSQITWAAIRTAAGTYADPTGQNKYVGLVAGTTSGRWTQLRRMILLFNTSSIPVGSQIVSATLSLYTGSPDSSGTLAGVAFVVVSSSPASNNNLVTADYQALGATALSDVIAFESLVVNTWTTFTLNDAGLAAITPEGITKLGLRDNAYDRVGGTPTWQYAARRRAIFMMAELVASPPTLHVHWKPPL